MAAILFVPICSNCKTIIEGRVGTKLAEEADTDLLYGNNKIMIDHPGYIPEPSRCPACGVFFVGWCAPDPEALKGGTVNVQKSYREYFGSFDKEETDGET